MTSISGRNAAFLEEMGIGPLWVRRHAGSYVPQEQPESEAPSVRSAAPVSHAAAPVRPADNPHSLAPVLAPAAQGGHNPSAAEVAGMDWAQLKAAVAGCTKCNLCLTRKQTVFGVGDEKAEWLFVGEGPGRNEDLQGEPFVGPAGKLLDNMLLAMGLKRGVNTYIANIVKCRPTDANGRDRPPSPEEAAACMPYLERQIALIRPAVIVALGKTAALSLLQLDPATPVSKLRGTVHRYAGQPLVVTYHPAYLLRNPVDKRKAWDDLCMAMNLHSGAAPAP
ncbi:MAG TPA: uracil-DNA glycosylase [Burkholderiaceae bacterium]|jgi:DNA polymerase|nr:uracil-DNA glycosylase [Burkholderiaceae bacterium]